MGNRCSGPYGCEFFAPSPTGLTCVSWSAADSMTQHGLGFRGGNINTAFSFASFSNSPSLQFLKAPHLYLLADLSPSCREGLSVSVEGGSRGSAESSCGSVLTARWAPPPRRSDWRPPAVFFRQTSPAAPRCNSSLISAPWALISTGESKLRFHVWPESTLSVKQQRWRESALRWLCLAQVRGHEWKFVVKGFWWWW